MADFLRRRPGTILFLIGLYYVLAIALRVLRSPAVNTDEAEQAFLSQFLSVGYGAQPPLYNWVQYAISQVMGASVLSLSVTKNLLLFLFVVCYGLAARVALRDRSLASIAMLGPLTLSPVFLLAQNDLSHTVAALFCVSLFLWGLCLCLTAPSLGAYLLTGFAAGLGCIAKYNFAFVPAAALIAMAIDPAFRPRLLDRRILAALLAGVAIAIPHALWMPFHLDALTGNTLAEMREGTSKATLPIVFHGALSFTGASLQAIAPPLIFFALIFWGQWKAIAVASSPMSRLVGRTIALCFLIVFLVMLATKASHMREKWLVLYTALMPLWLALKVSAAGIDAGQRLGRATTLILTTVMLGLTIIQVRVPLAASKGRFGELHEPWADFAQRMREHGTPATILCGDLQAAGNMKVQFPDAMVYDLGHRKMFAPPASLTSPIAVVAAGAMLDDATAMAALTAIAAPEPLQRLDLPFPGKGGKTYPFAFAFRQ